MARPYRPGPMTSDELAAALKIQIWSSAGFIGGEVTDDRRKAMDLYLGNPLGNEIEGRSQVVSSDVQDVVEAIMPDLIQMFLASDDVVRYEPVGPEDEEFAKQASDYVNHVVMKENDGFNLIHDWFKDGLLQINGVVKVWWDESEEETVERYTGLTDEEKSVLEADDDITIEDEEYTFSDEARALMEQVGIDADTVTEEEEALFPPELIDAAKLWNMRITRKKEVGKLKVVNVPPEEFLISRRATSLEDAPFCCHRMDLPVSDLIEMGFEREQVENLPSSDGYEFNEERIVRFDRETELPFDRNAIRSMREIRVFECIVKVDYDGDGVAELRRVMLAGPAYEVLRYEDGGEANEVIGENPFCSITPIRMPHKYFGRSLADLVEDVQKIKTSVLRSVLDNAYNVNNSRSAISNKVNIDDVLNNRVAAPIRVKTDTADVSGHVVPVVTQPLGNHLFPVLEYMDTVRETRSGISRLGQGVDPDAMNSTARGINMLLGRTQQRVLLIAQVYANGGVKDLFRKALRIIVMHQERERMIRLRGKFVKMDPRHWNARMDVDINVGLGRGTQDQQMMAMQMFGQIMQQIIQLQGGAAGPLVTLDKVYNYVAKMGETLGMRSVEPFINEIDEQQAQKLAQQQGQRPDPEMAKVEYQTQLDAKKVELDQQREMKKLDTAAQKAKADESIERQKALWAKELEEQKAQWEFALKAWIAEQEAGLTAEKFDVEAAIKTQGAAIDHDIKVSGAEVDKEMKKTRAGGGEGGVKLKIGDGDVSKMFEGFSEIAEQMKNAVQEMNRPKEIVRDKDGRPKGIKPV